MSSENEGPVAWLRAQVEAAKAEAEAWILGRYPYSAAEAAALYDVRERPGMSRALDAIARCEAELAILDEHRGEVSEWGGHRPDGTWQQRGLVCITCGHDDGRLGVAWPCQTVRLVASGYRHRPGYREEWKP